MKKNNKPLKWLYISLVFFVAAASLSYHFWFTSDIDTTAPTVLVESLSSGSLVPKGTHELRVNYFDHQSGVFTGTLVNIDNNIAPEALVTASPVWFWGTVAAITNGVKRTDGAFDYEYHSSSSNAFINFDFSSPREIGAVKIYNRTGCCSGRLSGALVRLYDANNVLLYTHTLPNTTGMREIDINFARLGELHTATRVSLTSVGPESAINIREIEIFSTVDNLKLFKYSVTGAIPNIENNIAPEATLTATHSFPWSISGIANGVKRTDGAFDYEYHSSIWNAFIDFNFWSPREVGGMRIYNRTGCCSERLSWAIIELYDANNDLLYRYTLPNTAGMREIDVNFVELGQVHMVKRINLRNVNGQVINLREIEIFPIVYSGNFNFGEDIAAQVVTQSWALSATGASYNIAFPSYWKYRYYFSIEDYAGNRQIYSGDIYVDEPELTVSTSEIDMGVLGATGITESPEVTVTVKTVWAGFELFLKDSGALVSDVEQIQRWDGSRGYGVELIPYTWSLIPIDEKTPFISQEPDLSTNWAKKTHTYTINFGWQVGQEQSEWVYEWNVGFKIKLNY